MEDLSFELEKDISAYKHVAGILVLWLSDALQIKLKQREVAMLERMRIDKSNAIRLLAA